MIINKNKKNCYRIYHVDNLEHLLRAGLCNKNHPEASKSFKPIGNPGIINAREATQVRISGYGVIGEYVPFYFTPRSIMLLNIITGYWAPTVPKIAREKIIVVRSTIDNLSQCGRFFFTNGQANDAATKHFNDLSDLDKIDWDIIQKSNFKKSDGDFDRPRRYQAEFLVHSHVPISAIESIAVYNDNTANFVSGQLGASQQIIKVNVIKDYFF